MKALALEAAYLVGQYDAEETTVQARRLAQSTDPATRAKAYCTLTSVAVDRCQYQIAQTYLQHASQQAIESGDVETQCESQLRLLPVLLNMSGPGAALGTARSITRLVAAAGDPHLFALLHVRLAEVEARRGLLELALRHLQAGYGHLEHEANYIIEATYWLDRCAVEIYLGHFDGALRAALATSKAAVMSGHKRHQIAALGNEAFARTQLGQLDRSEQVFDAIPAHISEFPNHHLAVLDNKSELRVLQGRLEEADHLLRQATQLATDVPGLRNSWQHLAAIESRVRLLHLRGDSRSAGELALAAEQDAGRRSDNLLRLSYRLLRTSILLDSGSLDEAELVLRDLVLHRDQLSHAQDLDLDRLLGDYFGRRGNLEQGRDHVLRAARLQERFFNAITRVYLHRTAAAIGLQGIGSLTHPPASLSTSSIPIIPQECPLDAISLKAIEQLFQLPSIPELLGREVLSVLFRTRCVSHAVVQSGADEGSEHEAEEKHPEFIRLGTFLGKRYRIEARPRSDLVSLEVFMTIRRLVMMAVRLNVIQNEEAVKTALWRFESISTEGAPLVASTVMQQVLITIHQLAASDVPVLLTGETGTGKEVYARELHRASRLKGPFVPFNCTAVAADMLDSQLFGHRRGAFTGATENFQGIARSASQGTLFLDEIGEMGIDLQPKLLRLLDRSEIHPLGEPQPLTVRVRLVAATNANLESLMAAGRFREDLYYRLNVGRVHIPPLRERREEIPALADHFLEQYALQAGRQRLSLKDNAIETLLLYRWPGNVRQLASEMRRLVAYCKPGSIVDVTDLSPDIRVERRAADVEKPSVANAVQIPLDQPLDAAVEQLERAIVQHALSTEGGHVERAAARLMISRKGLFLKRRRLGLSA